LLRHIGFLIDQISLSKEVTVRRRQVDDTEELTLANSELHAEVGRDRD
jgi:hypothetical protein